MERSEAKERRKKTTEKDKKILESLIFEGPSFTSDLRLK